MLVDWAAREARGMARGGYRRVALAMALGLAVAIVPQQALAGASLSRRDASQFQRDGWQNEDAATHLSTAEAFASSAPAVAPATQEPAWPARAFQITTTELYMPLLIFSPTATETPTATPTATITPTATPTPTSAATPANWPQYGGNPEHTGNNTQETSIGPTNVASLAPIFQVALPGVVDGAPIYLAGVSTTGGPGT